MIDSRFKLIDKLHVIVFPVISGIPIEVGIAMVIVQLLFPFGVIYLLSVTDGSILSSRIKLHKLSRFATISHEYAVGTKRDAEGVSR